MGSTPLNPPTLPQEQVATPLCGQDERPWPALPCRLHGPHRYLFAPGLAPGRDELVSHHLGDTIRPCQLWLQILVAFASLALEDKREGLKPH